METNRRKFFRKHNLPPNESLSLPEIASLSNMPIQALRKVYIRGIGAYKTNPISVRMKETFKKNIDAPMSMKLSKEQWAFARVYAFVMKTPKVFYGADKDIAEQYNIN